MPMSHQSRDGKEAVEDWKLKGGWYWKLKVNRIRIGRRSRLRADVCVGSTSKRKSRVGKLILTSSLIECLYHFV